MVQQAAPARRENNRLTEVGSRRSGEEAGLPFEQIRDAVHDCMEASRCHLTATDLERIVAKREGCPRPLVRSAIRRLVDQGVLEYRYTFGQSYLALSFRGPVSVGSQFVIVPPHYKSPLPSQRHVITIAPGAAFGCGRHPTTLLALEALERGWALAGFRTDRPGPAAIDIGTGSGILAIGAAWLGAGPVLALDLDACARSEARRNITLSGKSKAIAVSAMPLETVEDNFSLVIANLRLPTLVQLAGWMRSHFTAPGCIVVSGFRDDEWRRLREIYTAGRLTVGWYACRSGWAGGVFLPA